jgi:hypothetical protein
VLSADEIARNAAVDQDRFAAPPVVSIGGKECTNIAVISTTQLKCTVPPGIQGENVSVAVTNSGGVTKTIPYAYTYVSDTSFYVTDINPDVGPTFGGTPMILTGSLLNTIASVTINGTPCDTYPIPRPDPIPEDSPTSYTCAIPILDTDGHKNVVVTLQSGTSYTFANAFKYVRASRDPLKANIQ